MMTESLAAPLTTRPSLSFRLGAGLLVVFGLGHLAAHFAMLADLHGSHGPLIAEMVKATVSVGGVTRTLVQALEGFSLTVSLFGLSSGVILWVSGAALAAAGAAPKRLALVGSSAAAGALLVSLAYFPVPAIVITAASAAAFVIATR
jgi:hypothetical protein